MKTTTLFALAAVVATPVTALAEDNYTYDRNTNSRSEVRNERINKVRETREDIRNDQRNTVQDRVNTRRGAVNERIDARRNMRNSNATAPAAAPKP